MKLTIEKRTATGKSLAKLRKNDIMPAIVYAKHIKEPMMIQCRRQDFVKLYKEGGRSTVITLEGDGIKQDVLIHDLQIDPVTHKAIHADLLAVKAGQSIEAEVSLTLVGKSPAVTSSEIKVQQLRNSIAIEAMPKDLPGTIEIDISVMENLGDIIYVRDLNLPKGVTAVEEGDIALVSVNTLAGGGANSEEENEESTEGENTEEASE